MKGVIHEDGQEGGAKSEAKTKTKQKEINN